ncbi:hypothetical protein L7F22_049411 [Adiantum nelumboides]|nr:hypothetical protein [Adiantum nelumboides]
MRREPCARESTLSTSTPRSPAVAATSSPPAAPRTAAPSASRSAPPATRSTPASRRSWTPVAAWPASRPATGSASAPPSSSRHGARRLAAREEAGAVSRSHPSASKESPMSTQSVDALLDEHAELEQRLADPDVLSDQAQARKLGRRYAELGPVVRCARELAQVREDRDAARELAAEDRAFAAEADALDTRIVELETELTELLRPRDPHDGDDIVMEVKSGEGGEESALFAGDLVRMYTRYAECRGWKVEVLGATPSDLGGYKDITLSLRSKDPVDGVWAALKFEGGVHRVQRVPVTESQGRIHTSAAGVLVFPDADDTPDVEIHDADIRVDVYRASGHGGQSVNTTDSAVRITHLPTGIVVTCQNERSQLQNKARAMDVLRVRLQAKAEAEAAEAASEQRRSQVRTVDRSERIRTYNYPENRISDHRVGFKAYNLSAVLDGHLVDVLAALTAAERAEAMAGEQGQE